MKRMMTAAVIAMLPAVSASAGDFPAGRVVSGVTGDWNKDGRSDLALLVAPEDADSDEALLYLYLADKTHNLLRPVSEGAYSLWGNTNLDGMFGRDPELKALDNGSLAVTTQNSGIGRNRWTQTVTIAWRDSQFIVAGFTYNWNDTLDIDNPDSNGSCDYNVLSGKYVLNGTSQNTAPSTVSLKDWSDERGIKVCGVK